MGVICLLVNILVTITLLVFTEPVSFSQNCDLLITADVSIASWPPIPPPPDEFAYHDGAPFWLSWSGKYRGTWFNVFDFTTASLGCQVDGAELWFYHHVSYPWDTSDFYLEIWEGDIDFPYNQLESNLETASHYAPVICSFSSIPIADHFFWIIVDTEMSNGGWPSSIGDSGLNFTGENRSFVSEDFIIWEPWNSNEACSFLVPLDRHSWGQLKSLFN